MITDAKGNWKVNLGILTPGAHYVSITAKDVAGNTENTYLDVTIEQPKTPEAEPEKESNSIFGGIKESFSLIPSLIEKIKGTAETVFDSPEVPSKIVTVTKEVPPVLQGKWRLLPTANPNN